MLITTTSTVAERATVRTLGLVGGEAILGINVIRDLFGSMRDFLGGRVESYEDELRKARDTAIAEMAEQARMMGANAVTGVIIDFEAIGGKGSMILVCASGTAVILE